MNAHQKITAVQTDGDMPTDAEIDAGMWRRLSRHSNKTLALIVAARKLVPGDIEGEALLALLEAAETAIDPVATCTRARKEHYDELAAAWEAHEQHEAQMAKHPNYIAPRPRVAPLPDEEQSVHDVYQQAFHSMQAIFGKPAPIKWGSPVVDLANAADLALVVWRDLIEATVSAQDAPDGYEAAKESIEHAEHELGVFTRALCRAKGALGIRVVAGDASNKAAMKGRGRARKAAKPALAPDEGSEIAF